MNKFKRIIKKSLATATSIAVLSVSILPASLAVATPVYAAPQMELTNTVDKDYADRGNTLTYTITIKNTGDKDMTSSFVWINKPNLADYVAGSSKYQGFPGGSVKSLTDAWINDGVNFGTIPAGKWVVLNYKTKVASNANHGDIVWSAAFAKSDQNAKVQASASTEVFFENPGLCAVKKADKSTVSPGEKVTYTIEVCNSGNMVLNNVRLYDELPDEVSYVDGSTTYTRGDFNTVVTDAWVGDGVNLGDLDTVNKGVFKFQVKVKSHVKDGTKIINSAKLKSDQTPTWIDCKNEITVKVKGGPEFGSLKIFKFEDVDGDAAYDSGEKGLPGFTFRIVGNGEDITVTTESGGVAVVNNLPAGTYTITETVPSGWRITTDNNIKVTVKVDGTTEVRFGNKQVGKVLGKIKQLPDTGPGLILALFGASIPVGIFIRRLKTKI